MDRNLITLGGSGVGSWVALRKESVDRNTFWEVLNLDRWLSLSARRAWIEILPALKLIACQNVALRKESVDRNENTKPAKQAKARRSPQGERG